MISGILLIDKPKGRSSFSLVAGLRRLCKVQKIGHAGTLDPFATGVMVMLIGKAYTRLSNQFLNEEKEYLATLQLGVATNTFDEEGEDTFKSDKIPTLFEIDATLKKFQGTLLQTPPMFSAKKVAGKKLYELARQGIEVERKPVEVTIKTEFLSYNYPYLELKIGCTKGTYIRSLADEIGRDLGSYAHLKELCRTKSGPFQLEECHGWEAVNGSSFDFKTSLRTVC